MKKIFLILTAAMSLMSCNFLDVIPEGKATVDDIYKTRLQADKYVCSMYAYQPNRFYFQSSFEICGGDMISGHYGDVRYFSYKAMIYGAYESPSSTYLGMWSQSAASYPTGAVKYPMWEGVRNCYNIINNADRVPDATDQDKRTWKGEAYFMIAYIHYTMLQYYGPTVIVRGESSLNEASNDPRSTYDECVNFIADMCDKAAELLPETWDPVYYGRATKAAAHTLKSGALLMAASPLANGNSEFYADFVNKDGTHLISQTYDAEKWKKVMDASEAGIIEAEKDGFKLYETKTSGNDDFQRGYLNYHTAFTGADDNYNHDEFFFSYNNQSNVQYNIKNMGPRIGYTSYNSAGFRGYFVPTFDAVELYLSKNGLPMDVDPETKNLDLYSIAPGDSTVLLHRNREPRFYASIGYDRGTYEINGGTIVLKCRRGEPQQNDGVDKNEYQSCTGYYIQKWICTKDGFNTGSKTFTYGKWAYPYMRLADLYFNYVEAEAEYTGTLSSKGLNYINKIRHRAGLPNFEDSWARVGGMPTGQKLVDVIRQERLIEFMFEGRMYHDLRRWKMAEKYMKPTPKAWNLAGKTAEEFYQVSQMNEGTQVRTFETPRNYWLAIPIDQININPSLVQNPGY